MSDNYVTNIAQQALDQAGIDHLLGDIEDGTRPAQVCLRWYRQCLQQLLRAAMWDFARKTAPLELLADSSGSTPNVGTITPGGLFQFEYALPTDAMKIRWIPWHQHTGPGAPPGNIVPPNNNLPLLAPGSNNVQNFHRPIPARFLITSDNNYPAAPGAQNWDVQGVSPQGRTVILTNVPHAHAVYTFLCLYPSVWDSLFREALVAYMASEIALPLSTDKKLGLEMRNQQMAIAKAKIIEARAASANEGWNTNDITTDWMRFRRSGGDHGWGGPNHGGGGFWGGLDGCCGAGSVVGGAAF